MVFALFAYQETLRDIEACQYAWPTKLYTMRLLLPELCSTLDKSFLGYLRRICSYVAEIGSELVLPAGQFTLAPLLFGAL
jgi:hypothetical protein